MRHISYITNVACINEAREDQKKIEIDPRCSRLVNNIFIKFALLCRDYDSIYADTKRENAEKIQWIVAFMKRGITTKDKISRGLDKIELHKWPRPPQLGQFLEWCEQSYEDIGILPCEQAFIRLPEFMLKGGIPEFSDNQRLIMENVIHRCDPWFLKNNSISRIRPIFFTNYEIVTSDFMRGLLGPIPRALDAPKSPVTMKGFKREYSNVKTHEEAMRAMRKIL